MFTLQKKDRDTGANRSTIEEVIRKLPSTGGTIFEPALLASHQLLLSTPATLRALVFLSDGRDLSGRGGPFPRSVARFKADGLPIYTVAFGAQADRRRLERMAGDTGGLFFPAAQFDVQKVFASIGAEARGLRRLLEIADTIFQGMTGSRSRSSPGAVLPARPSPLAGRDGLDLRIFLTQSPEEFPELGCGEEPGIEGHPPSAPRPSGGDDAVAVERVEDLHRFAI